MKTARALRIGVTMREVEAPGYYEPRDALAQDWSRFLAAALPGVAWLPVPNLGRACIAAWCEAWQLNALILTGGEDVGKSPLRDDTERALLALARERAWPALGVCRGLQLMWAEQGGELRRAEGHAGTRHLQDDGTRELNSFHHNLLDETNPPPGAQVLVRAADGSAEAVTFAGQSRWLGIMWHPEREPQAHPADVAMLHKHFPIQAP